MWPSPRATLRVRVCVSVCRCVRCVPKMLLIYLLPACHRYIREYKCKCKLTQIHFKHIRIFVFFKHFFCNRTARTPGRQGHTDRAPSPHEAPAPACNWSDFVCCCWRRYSLRSHPIPTLVCPHAICTPTSTNTHVDMCVRLFV